MKNTYKLIWSDEAIQGLKEIFNYLEYNFPQKDVKKFAIKLDKQLELIATNPEIFPLSIKSKSIRRCLVAKLTSIYFRITSGQFAAWYKDEELLGSAVIC